MRSEPFGIAVHKILKEFRSHIENEKASGGTSHNEASTKYTVIKT